MLILASKSPRRRELLAKIYPREFKVVPANIDERSITCNSILELPKCISQAKASAVSNKNPQDYVLAADTIVICDGKVYGKPSTEREAFEMLSKLTKQEHIVVTGYHIYLNGNDLLGSSAVTKLVLRSMTDRQIEDYIKTGSPFDKAGGYGAQDAEIDFEIKTGTYENVLGFPVDCIESDLSKLGII
ncbi:MAG: Maf family protein [Bacilli bacterium]